MMKQLCALILISALALTLFTGCYFLDDSILGGGALLPPLGNNTDGGDTFPPLGGNTMQPPEYIGSNLKLVTSIDRLNYYSALRVLDKSHDMLSSYDETRLVLLTAYAKDSDEDYPEKGDSTEAEEGTSSDASPGVEVIVPDGVYYYELSPYDKFVFTKISMFQIELTDENGFLASKLGVGTVDVVISEGCIWGDSLITFRLGDRFFSCLSNGESYDKESGRYSIEFSTHKFISGFYIVKNIAQENYTFTIEFDPEGQALSFAADEFKLGGTRADKNVEIASITEHASVTESFTAVDLDEYFKGEDEKEV